jgi:hypothetical protein
MRPALRSATLALVLAASACASSGGSAGAPEPFGGSEPTTVRIIIQNLNFQDARLYTYRADTRRMLGTVTGNSNREFVIDWDFPARMYLEIDMLAGPRCFTEALTVDPGDILELQIASRFANTAGCRSR